ncbi:Mss4-like protein [Dichotomocladium elegans]|nr:Mss4-like protein [Dichotomocladium elegans]
MATEPIPFHKLPDPLNAIVDPNTGKNRGDIFCPIARCRCLVIRKGAAELIECADNKLALPETVLSGIPIDEEQQRAAENEKAEIYFWKLGNMMDFENVGFSKTVDTVKYLSCADCDVGPIGYHDTASNPKKFLVSVSRARYRF